MAYESDFIILTEGLFHAWRDQKNSKMVLCLLCEVFILWRIPNVDFCQSPELWELFCGLSGDLSFVVYKGNFLIIFRAVASIFGK